MISLRSTIVLSRLFVLAMFVSLAGCGTMQTNYITGQNQRGAYTWEQEVQIGQQTHAQVVQMFGIYDDPALTNYVSTVGMRVLEESAWVNPDTPMEVRNTQFHFFVLDSHIPNAMALPGGYIYVTRGLMAFLENEAQLAMVLGHEVGHVLGRHASQRMAQAQTGQLGLLGATILGAVIGGERVAQGIMEYGGAGMQLLFLGNSREAEREADRAGVAYAEFAGYDAAQGARFFTALQRLGELSGGNVPSFLSTHPDPGERRQTIPQLAAQMDPRGTLINRDNYLNQVSGMVLGENPRNGYAEGNTFYHPELQFRFNFPGGWQVANAAAAVQVGHPSGTAMLQFTFADGQTARAAGQAFATQEGFTASDQRALTVNGLTAYSVTGTANTQSGELGLVVYFIEHRGNVYQFFGAATANTFSQVRSTLISSLGSFANETSPSVLNRQPVRVELVRVNTPTRFQDLLRNRPPVQGMGPAQIAIMNEVDLNDVIPAGATIKLPR